MARRRTASDLRTGARARRGSSFVEVLLAMTIMALVLVGILQMFSVSLIINKGAAARTQMLFKCQQVVENIRWYYYVTGHSLATPTGTGIPALGAVTVDLPYDGTETDPADGNLLWTFWGPNGANVMEAPNGPYQIRYVIQQDPAQAVKLWVTIASAPAAKPAASS